jgi:hypothetical protein
MVQVSRVDPLRGWLSFDFIGLPDEASTTATSPPTPSSGR